MTLEEREEEANSFAMELLMPESFVRAYLASHMIDFVDGTGVKEMAKKFGVTESMMMMRIGMLKQ